VEEDRHRAGMEACSGVAEQAAVVVGGSAAAQVWVGWVQAQAHASAHCCRLGCSSLALTFGVVRVCVPVDGGVTLLSGVELFTVKVRR
jgi:hypothetical protein